MSNVVGASWCIALAAILLGITALATFRQPLIALRVMVDLFVAAGLLRLSVDLVGDHRRHRDRDRSATPTHPQPDLRPDRGAPTPGTRRLGAYTFRRSLSLAISAVTTSRAMLWP